MTAPPAPATAFVNAADGLLWEGTAGGGVRRVANGLGLAAGSTPAVAQTANGRVVAFRAGGTGNLWIVDANDAGHDTGVAVMPGSSPAIAAHPLGGYEVVFRRQSDGLLWAVDGQYTPGAVVTFAREDGELTRLRDDALQMPTGDLTTAGSPAVSLWRPSGPITLVVPNVVGATEDDAVRSMTAAGLTLSGTSPDNSCTAPAGTVAGQDPRPGLQTLAVGAPFTLSVSSGNNTKGKPCTIQK